MKLPFLNRKKYVVIKAYTNSSRAFKEVPLTLTKDVKHDGLNPEWIPAKHKKYIPTFDTCYGRIAALRNSITLRTWSEFDIVTNKERWDFRWPHGNKFMSVVETQDDAFRPDDLFVLKICPPWMLDCDTPVEVLHCSHILNTSHLHIASGIAPPTKDPSLNFFTYLPKREDFYHIPYRMPIIQMFPLTDLPIHVESSYDARKYEELHTMTISNPYFSGTALKCTRHENSTL